MSIPCIFRIDMPLLLFHHQLCKGKPDPCTVLLSVFSPVEAFKKMGQVFFAESLSAVCETDFRVKGI